MDGSFIIGVLRQVPPSGLVGLGRHRATTLPVLCIMHCLNILERTAVTKRYYRAAIIMLECL